MALPAGALTATVTVGGSVGIAGTSAVVSNFTVTPEYRLVWGATGDAIDTFAEDGTAGSIVILADQPGVFASSTVNGAAGLVEVRGWPLVARWRVTSGGDSRWHTRRFAAPTAGTTVDVDMLPQDGAAVPGTVTYAQTITYNGLTALDNGDGTLTLSSPTGAITDNGDGTLTI